MKRHNLKRAASFKENPSWVEKSVRPGLGSRSQTNAKCMPYANGFRICRGLIRLRQGNQILRKVRESRRISNGEVPVLNLDDQMRSD